MQKEEILKSCAKCLGDARKKTPLCPSITNTVTINFVANAQLAAGGSAAMVYLPDEGELLGKICDAFYINFGTLFPIYEETLPKTMETLHKNNKMWVIDPVGLGIGSLRTKLETCAKEFKPSIIRGNASEIISLAKLWGLLGEEENKSSGAKGVDSTDEVMDAKTAAMALANYTGGSVAVSGKTDLVTNGKLCVLCHGGSAFLPLITGAGCSLGGVCAVFASTSDAFIGALTATLVYNSASSKAEKYSAGPGNFQPNFLDEIYKTSEEDLLNSNIEII